MRRPLRSVAGLALTGALAAAGLPCRAEVRPGETQGLGLRGPAVPAFLKAVAADPYRAPAAPACETIPAEIKALDAVLGADADQPRKERSLVMRQAIGAVRGMVPYRGVVRFLTRADHQDHELMNATMAGFARRGFLRGLEANLRCADGPVAPAVVATAESAGIQASYTVADPGVAPAARPDLTTLMLTDPPANPAPDGAAPDPGR
ncbi:MAG: hypothetical protein JWP28_3492 [Phenylobacterium sp.]|jgi:hypothetical protein|uniref:hypothetical protein n=1 Tax=Phenylobacterium sp. TaxID=1871053 RepID=UPI002609AB3A|nr:hypothetical protein [Phenylobacterium sp.]MDB5499461.1 hypothetical protein [Phenylobacterium sp.]